MSLSRSRQTAVQVSSHLVVVLAVLSAGVAVRGDEPRPAASIENTGSSGPAADDTPLRFRRMYAPAGQPEAWPRQRAPYFPMQPKEFERLLGLARTAAHVGDDSVTVAVTSAQYEARLEGDDLVDGEATLEVAHHSTHRTTLRLDPCGLAIGKATWAGAENQPAEWGQATDGKLAVLVDKAGKLQLNWSLRGRREAEGPLEFSLEFPSCPSTRLIVELPGKMVPLSDHGATIKLSAGTDQTTRWQIDLGGHHRARLRVVPEADLAARRQTPCVRQSLVYEFSLQGLELSAHLQFDVHEEPVHQVVLTLDPGLRLVTARYGSTMLPWTTTIPSPKDPAPRVVLEFPEPVQGTARTVRLGLLAPLQVGTPWRLPGIRLEATCWQEGKATLIVSSPLVVERLTPLDSRQMKVGLATTPGSGETMELQYFAPGAGAEILLGQPQAPLQVDRGTMVELGGGEMTARTAAEFTVTEGEVFELEAQVARQWIVDTVESVPGETLGDWNLERGEDGAQKLTLRLAHALSPTRPVRFQITGRRLHSPLGRWLGIEDLLPFRFRAAPGGRRLVSLHSVEPYQLKTRGTDQLTLVDPQHLDPAAARLLTGPVGSLLFEDDAGAKELQVSLAHQSPQYAATIRVEAAASDGSLIESYRLSCIPVAAPIGRVLVRFSHRRSQPLRWTLINAKDDALVVRPFVGEDRTEESAAGDTWEITLQQPQSVPFEIRASRVSPLAKQQPLSLASLPEATGQRATLVVSSNDVTVVRVEGNQLEPIPTEAVPADQYTSVQATYRYYPAHNSAPSPEATLAVLPRSAATTLPAAWVWSCRLESRYDATGTGRHLAVYELESAGRRQVELTLPLDGQFKDVRGIWVDDARALWRRVDAKERRRLAVDLPAGRKFPVVSIHYTTTGGPLGVLDQLTPAPPQIDVPVLACRWTAWLPPGYEAVDPDLRWQPRRTPQQTWMQRLFGPLGRGPAASPFDPFDRDDWSVMTGNRPARLAALGKARLLLERLGEATANGREGESAGPDWRTVLTAPAVEKTLADQSGGQKKVLLLLHQRALAQRAVTPHTPVPRPTGGTSRARGAAMLQQAGLTLLVHPEAIVVVETLNAALDHAYLEPVDHGRMWWIRPGPLADRVQEAIDDQADEAFVRLDAWKETSSGPQEPWTLVRPAGFQASDTIGWTAYQLEIPAEASVQLDVVHGNTLQGIRWTVFLAVIALTWWRPIRQSVMLLVLVGLFGVAALVLPAAYASVASGALLGVLFCLGMRLLCSQREGEAEEPSTVGRRSSAWLPKTVSGMPVLLVGIGFLLFSQAAWGDEPAAKPSPPAPTPVRSGTMPAASAPVYNVLIPVGENDQPTGEPYQVPQEFYQELHRRAAVVTEEPQGWLLRAATYRGSLVWQGTPESLVPGELKAVFDLQVLSPQTRLRLRLGRQGLNLVPDGTALDGRVIQPEWEEDGSVLAFDVEEPGRYQLELAVRPIVESGESGRGFTLSIPRLAGSRLELTLPPNAPVIEVPTALGTVVQEADPSRVVAELGPGERLNVRWKESAARDPAGSAVEAEQLLWLKVQPDSVVLDVQLKLRNLEGGLSELRLTADPRLRLLPIRDSKTAVTEVEVLAGQPQTIRLVLARTASDSLDLAASFLLTETSGIGQLRLPRLELQGVRTTKRWLGVGVDPALHYEQRAADGLETIAVPAFSAAWGAASVQPLFAYGLPDGEPAWELATRPLGSQTVAAQSLALSFDLDQMLVQLTAGLKTSSGYRFQYRIQAPPELEVQKVSLQSEELERVARWSRTPDGTISLFLNAPVTGEQRLSLQGRLAVKKRDNVPLPVLRIDGVEMQSNVVQMFRKPAVLVRVAQAQGLAEIEPPLVSDDQSPLGRPVKSFQVKSAEAVQVGVAITPNRPKILAEQTTSVRFDGEQREAKVEFRMQVEQGVVDQWRVEVPPQWSGPYEVDPPAPVKVVTIPGQTRRQLIVQPRTAVSEEDRLSISGPMTLAPGEQVAVPEIRLEAAETVRHLLILPTQSQLNPVVWETQGLKQVPLPESFAAVPVSRESFVAYQAEQPSFQAILRPLVGLPQVFLADISVAWQADGTCYGAVLFDLQSAGLAHCWLRLPAACQLVQVTVAGVPTAPRRGDDSRWQVPLSPSAFPQRMEILFTGRLAQPSLGGTCQLEAPILDELPIRQTLWTIAGPSLCQPHASKEPKTISRLEQDLIRLRTVSALIEQAAEATNEEPEQTVQWHRTWARRWLDLEGEIRRQLAPAGTSDAIPSQPRRQEIAKELESLGEQQSLAARRMGGSQVMAQLVTETPMVDSPHRLWQTCLEGSSSVIRCASEGGASVLTLQYRTVEAGSLAPRVRVAMALATLVGLMIWASRRGILAAMLQRWPHVLGTLFGLVWWLWLWPSILGGLIVLVNVAATLRQQGRGVRGEGRGRRGGGRGEEGENPA